MATTEPAHDRENYYQPLLRRLGAQLDDIGASDVGITELLDGFLVQLGDGLTLELLEDDLQDLESILRGQRAAGSGAAVRAGRYQDVLRALGYELDRVRAHSVQIEELQDGFVVRYRRPEATDDTVIWHSETTIWGPARALLDDAYARRGTGGPTRGTRRRGGGVRREP